VNTGVVATGGGVVTLEAARRQLESQTTYWLTAPTRRYSRGWVKATGPCWGRIPQVLSHVCEPNENPGIESIARAHRLLGDTG